jgi:hypothetical protein
MSVGCAQDVWLPIYIQEVFDQSHSQQEGLAKRICSVNILKPVRLKLKKC